VLGAILGSGMVDRVRGDKAPAAAMEETLRLCIAFGLGAVLCATIASFSTDFFAVCVIAMDPEVMFPQVALLCIENPE
jgi:hypothetical protein